MISDTQAVVLAKSQGACLAALRTGKSSLTQIAMVAGLSVKRASLALAELESLGLAERSPDAERSLNKVWRTTSRGDTCVVRTAARNRSHVSSRTPSPSGRRLLELLERPTQGRSLARKLGLSRQGAIHVMRRLYAQGHVKFGDPEDPSWWVMRTEDETPLLTRDQERVLSTIPGEYATNAVKVHRRTLLPTDRVEAALHHLVGCGFAEAVGEFNGAALFRVTAAGIGHPQNRPAIRDAEPPHLPVYSDRVRVLLSAIGDAGALRVRDLAVTLRWSFQSTNARMQYLKRKGLVQKVGEFFEAPYALTVMGRFTLAEMMQPGQMKFGYSKDAVEAAGQFGGSPPRRTRSSAVQKIKKVPTVKKAPTVKEAPTVKPPRPPVHSDRIQAVLSVISNAGPLRIKKVSDLLRLPPQSTNALMQYLKGKALVQKTGEHVGAPYVLTPAGRVTLAEMEQRRAA